MCCVCSSQGCLSLWHLDLREEADRTALLDPFFFFFFFFGQDVSDLSSKENDRSPGERAKILEPLEQKGPQKP